MSVGTQYEIHLHSDATNNIVLDGINVDSFTHDASFGASMVTNLKIGSYVGTTNFDNFIVKFSYPAGFATQPNTLTVNALVQAAFAAINTEILSGPRVGGVGPTPVIATLGAIVPGSSYIPGTYNYVKLIGGTGTGAHADIVVAVDGTVSGVTIVVPGIGYSALDSLTTLPGNIGGVSGYGVTTGSGFSVPVATVGSPFTNVTYI